jgi:hypothetical protein
LAFFPNFWRNFGNLGDFSEILTKFRKFWQKFRNPDETSEVLMKLRKFWRFFGKNGVFSRFLSKDRTKRRIWRVNPENSPAFQGWEKRRRKIKSPVRDESIPLPSLTGLWGLLRASHPALKRWAIFKNGSAAAAGRRRKSKMLAR